MMIRECVSWCFFWFVFFSPRHVAAIPVRLRLGILGLAEALSLELYDCSTGDVELKSEDVPLRGGAIGFSVWCNGEEFGASTPLVLQS